MTITQQQYDELVLTIQQLQGEFREWQADYDKLKGYFERHSKLNDAVFENIFEKTILPGINKHTDDIMFLMKEALDDRRLLTATMERVQELRRAIFPERYIEGADPVLTIRIPPEKPV